MMLAATLAGIGFGSAGVHIPHACAYPIAGLRHEYRPAGYPDDHGFVPHGLSVIVTSPAAFRFTYEAAPERHEHVAALLGRQRRAARTRCPNALLALMRDVGAPDRIARVRLRRGRTCGSWSTGARKQARLLDDRPAGAVARTTSSDPPRVALTEDGDAALGVELAERLLHQRRSRARTRAGRRCRRGGSAAGPGS